MLTLDRASRSPGRLTARSKPAKTVIRGGYGWFFDRFQSTNVLQAIRQNGINQQQYVVKNPAPGEHDLNPRWRRARQHLRRTP